MAENDGVGRNAARRPPNITIAGAVCLPPVLRRGLAGLLAAGILSGCSVVLVNGPPGPGDDDYDPTGAYPGGVPCTTSRAWPLVDTGMLLWALAMTATYNAPDEADDRVDGLLTAAAAAVSAWIGYRRTQACRELGDAAPPEAPLSRVAPAQPQSRMESGSEAAGENRRSMT